MCSGVPKSHVLAQNTDIVFNINNDNMCACSISWTGFFVSQLLMTLYEDIDHRHHYGINATYVYMYDAFAFQNLATNQHILLSFKF